MSDEPRAPDLTVVLPSFNAGPTIVESVRTLLADLTRAGVSAEIVVVDDGSTDGTAGRLGGLGDPRVRIMEHRRNRGKGASIKRGLGLARAPWSVFTDADLPYGTDPVLRCHRELVRGASLVVGDRTLPESRLESSVPLLRRLLSIAYIWLMRRVVFRGEEPGAHDTQCGVKGFSEAFARRVLDYSIIDRFSFDLEIFVIAAEAGVRPVHIPVVLRHPSVMSLRLVLESLVMFADMFQIAGHRRRGRYRRRGDA